MQITKEQAFLFASYILPNEIQGYCIDNYKDFFKFQTEGSKKEIVLIDDKELELLERECLYD